MSTYDPQRADSERTRRMRDIIDLVAEEDRELLIQLARVERRDAQPVDAPRE